MQFNIEEVNKLSFEESNHYLINEKFILNHDGMYWVDKRCDVMNNLSELNLPLMTVCKKDVKKLSFLKENLVLDEVYSDEIMKAFNGGPSNFFLKRIVVDLNGLNFIFKNIVTGEKTKCTMGFAGIDADPVYFITVSRLQAVKIIRGKNFIEFFAEKRRLYISGPEDCLMNSLDFTFL